MLLISKNSPEFEINTLILNNQLYRIDENVVNVEANSTSNIPRKSTDEDVPINQAFCPAKQHEYAKQNTNKTKKTKLIANAIQQLEHCNLPCYY